MRLVAALIVILAAGAAQARPLIAVVPFTGPQAKSAEAVVVRTLRRKASLVPPTSWKKSAKKLFAGTHKPDDIAAVAEDVGAVVVITGVVKRDGRKWQLAVSVRDGKTGHSHDKLKYPLKGPRITAGTLQLLAREVGAAFEHTLAAANGEPAARQGEEEEPAPKAEPQPTPQQRTEEPRAQAEEPAPQQSEDEEPPGPKPVEKPVTVEKTVPGTRPRWAPWLDVVAGGTISGRNFDFDPSSQPKFRSGIAGGLRVDATIYPFAFTWRKAAGVLATLGLGVTLEKPFWLKSAARDNPAQKFETNELEVEGGLRWRFVLYKKLPRPELTVLAGGGLHTFSIAKDMGTDVGPPDVAYKYFAVGGAFGLWFADWASLFGEVAYDVVFDAGPVQGVDEFGPGSVYGLRAGGGLKFLVWRGLELRLVGYYERFVVTFTGAGTPPAQKVASSAIDQYFGGALDVGYRF